MMNSQELATAVRLQPDLTVLILNEDAYSMIKWKQQDMEFDDYGLDYDNPDFVANAEAYGAKGYRVEAIDQIRPLLEQSFQAGGVHLIEVAVDYCQNNPILNHDIRMRSRNL